jgi:hypothetical protein
MGKQKRTWTERILPFALDYIRRQGGIVTIPGLANELARILKVYRGFHRNTRGTVVRAERGNLSGIISTRADRSNWYAESIAKQLEKTGRATLRRNYTGGIDSIMLVAPTLALGGPRLIKT